MVSGEPTLLPGLRARLVALWWSGGLRLVVRGLARQRLWLRGPHAAARHPWSGSKGFAQQLGFLEIFSEPRISAPFEKMAMGPPFISS